MLTVFCAKFVLWEAFRLLKAEAFMSLAKYGQAILGIEVEMPRCSREAMRGLIRGDLLKHAECDAPAPGNGTSKWGPGLSLLWRLPRPQ
jgi:hypothetical protein